MFQSSAQAIDITFVVAMGDFGRAVLFCLCPRIHQAVYFFRDIVGKVEKVNFSC